MPTSIRQQIIDAIAVRFATILTTGGYETDIGQKVTQWNVKTIDDRTIRGIDIMDVEEETTDQITRHQDHTLTIWAVVHAKESDSTAAYLRKAIADVWRAIGADRRWSTLARDTRAVKSEMLFNQAGQLNGAARIQFQVLYRTANFNPFSQSI